MNLKNILIGCVCALGLVGLNGCVNRAQQAQSKATEKFLSNTSVAVDVAPLIIKPMQKTLEITGSLTTSNDSQVGARQPGRITEVYVKDGDQVVNGQLLAEEDTTQLRASFEQAVSQVVAARSSLSQAYWNQKYGPLKSKAATAQARAQLNSAQASLKKELQGARPEERQQAQAALAAARTNRTTAEADLRRQQSLFDQGAIPQNQLDTAKNAYATALSQYDSAEQAVLIQKNGNLPEDISVARDAVRQAQQQLNTAVASQKLDVILNDAVTSAEAQLQSAIALQQVASANLSDAMIRAPFSGQVSGRPVQPGTVVSSGTTILQIVSTEGTYFDAQVPESNIAQVKVGAPVDVFVDALPNETFHGHVKALNPVGNQIGRLFSVRISIDGNTSELKSNMFVKGDIILIDTPAAVVAPTSAVITATGKPFVYTVDNGIAKKLPVQLGISNENYVQILGVPAGTMIVVKGQELLNDGTKVTTIQVTESQANSSSIPITGG